MFKYNDYGKSFQQEAPEFWRRAVHFARTGENPPDQPYQVEIHPLSRRTHICHLRCADCHGRFLQRGEGLDSNNYAILLRDLKALQVPSIVLSGAYSDPTMNDAMLWGILDNLRGTWPVKLHTFGINLNPLLRRKIIETALAAPEGGSYLTISKLTVDPEVYQALCHPMQNPELVLQEEEENLKALFRETESLPEKKLNVRINCRLTKINSHREQLVALLAWVKAYSPLVSVRFTTDYFPTLAPEDYRDYFYRELFVGAAEAEGMFQDALEKSYFPRDRASLRIADNAHGYEGDRCYNSLLFSAVATDGSVFPCQSFASPSFQKIAYGNIRTTSFSTIWKNYVNQFSASRIDGCPRCGAACERQVNNLMQKEIYAGA